MTPWLTQIDANAPLAGSPMVRMRF